MIRRLTLLAFVAGVLMVPVGAAAGGGCLPDQEVELTSSARRTVGISNCAFVDTVTYVDAGQTVQWVNEDHVPHTVTGAAGSWGSDEILNLTDRASYTFEEEGVFPYFCALHPAMVGAVVVGDGKGAMAAPIGAVSPVDAVSPVGAVSPVDAPEEGVPAPLVALGAAAGVAALVLGGRFVLGRRTSAAAAP